MSAPPQEVRLPAHFVQDQVDDSTAQLVADFLSRGGRVKTCKPETFNRWAQQHRRVRGAAPMKGRMK
jgi:hypothetical protein